MLKLKEISSVVDTLAAKLQSKHSSQGRLPRNHAASAIGYNNHVTLGDDYASGGSVQGITDMKV